MPFQLAVQGQQTPPRVVPLRAGPNLVGRSPRADIVLGGPLVSRTHAKLVVENGTTLNLYDLDSHNGTFVNGEKIRARVLNPGDHVYVGGFRMTVEVGATPTVADGAPVTVESLKLLEKTVATLVAARRGQANTTRDAGGYNLSLLARAAEALRRHTSPQEHLDHLLRMLKEALQAPFAVLLVGPPDGLSLRQIVGDPTGEPPVAWPLARRSVAESMAYFSRERAADAELADAPNVPGPAALLCVPLVAEPGGTALGAVQVVRGFAPGGYSDAEVESALLLAHVMASRLAQGEATEDVTETSNPTLDLVGSGGGLSREDVRAALLKAVPEELAERVLQAATGQGQLQPALNHGEQAVLFYDLHGFDAWAASQPPETVARVVGSISAAAASVASAFGGRLDQAMGAGGFMRFWDGSLEEASEAALRAAMDLRARMQSALTDEARVLKLRAGVDAGAVLAGVFGDGARATYTVVGTPARVAERIAEMAGQGEVYITAPVRNALAARSGWRLIALGPHALRGRSEAVDLFRVDGAPVGA